MDREILVKLKELRLRNASSEQRSDNEAEAKAAEAEVEAEALEAALLIVEKFCLIFISKSNGEGRGSE